jgi:hypothetical protein
MSTVVATAVSLKRRVDVNIWGTPRSGKAAHTWPLANVIVERLEAMTRFHNRVIAGTVNP